MDLNLFISIIFILEVVTIQVIIWLSWKELKKKEKEVEINWARLHDQRRQEIAKGQEEAEKIIQQAVKKAQEIITSATGYSQQWQEILVNTADQQTQKLAEELKNKFEQATDNFIADYKKNLAQRSKNLDQEFERIKEEKAAEIDRLANEIAIKVAQEKLAAQISPEKQQDLVIKLIEEKI